MPVFKTISEGDVNQHIQIDIDSQAALRTLLIFRITFRVVLECVRALSFWGRNNRVKLTWFPSSNGVAGNKGADILAKQELSSQFVGPEPVLGLSWRFWQGPLMTGPKRGQRKIGRLDPFCVRPGFL